MPRVSPVSRLNPLELVPYDAEEGGPQEPSLHSRLQQASHEQINVIHRAVEGLQAGHNLHGELLGKLLPAADSWLATN